MPVTYVSSCCIECCHKVKSTVSAEYYGAKFRGLFFNALDFDAFVAYGFYSIDNHGQRLVP